MAKQEAVVWYRRAAEQGFAKAQAALGRCYANGEGVTQDYGEAVKWYRKAAEQGEAGAQNNLGVCYESGTGVARHCVEAVKWYRKAAEQGETGAQNNLGEYYWVQQDYAEAVKWYRKAAKEGDAHAQGTLGECYWLGRGVQQDYAEAVKWFRKALKQGSEFARTELAQAEAEQTAKLHKDVSRGGTPTGSGAGGVNTHAPLSTFELTTKRAKAGDLDAQVALGYVYWNGEGVKRDYREGARWFRQAAERGSKWGQYNLALYYEYDGDLQHAAEWCWKAAEQGLPKAQDHLGRMYAIGLGVNQDRNEAKRWFLKAADQGVTVEQDKLHHYEELRIVAWKLESERSAWLKHQEAATQVSFNQPQIADRGIANSVSPRLELLSRIVSDYHESHTYRKNDNFVCGDMASEVWNIVQTKGIPAKIMIGNVERDVASPRDYNHAWVLAELSSEEWLALETTGGQVVRYDENRRYYSGHSFSNPKQLKEYSSLAHQLITANLKYNSAVDDYNQMVGQYNSADANRQILLDRELVQRKAIANQRKADLDELDGSLRTLLAERD